MIGEIIMSDSIKKSIIRSMVQKNFVECWEEKLSDDITIHKVEEDEDSDDIAYTSDGVKYSKKAVFIYLTEKGCAMDQANIDLAAKMINEKEGNVTITKYKTEKHHNLENATDEDLLNYINYKIFEEIENLKTQIMLEQFVDYKVEIITDTLLTNGIKAKPLESILKKYSDAGWKLKSVFTNEYRIGDGFEQTVLIFERSKFITDRDAINIIKEHRNK